MATAAAAKAPAAVEAPAPAPKKGGAMKLIIVIVLAVLVAGGGAAGGMWWWFQHNAAKDAKADTKDGKDSKDAKSDSKGDAKKEAGEPPQYVTVEPFVVNLAGESDHYLQTAMVLAVKDEATSEALKGYMPIIRNHILLLLSSMKSDDLNAPDAKTKLAQQILKETREIVPGKDEDKGIQNVLFSSFIIQ